MLSALHRMKLLRSKGFAWPDMSARHAGYLIEASRPIHENIYYIMQRSVKQLFRIFQGLAKKGRNGYRCNRTSEQEHQKRQILLVRVKER